MQSGTASNALGFDCSQFNTIDWAAAGPPLAAFAIIRATDGLQIVDQALTANAQGARAHGVPHGFYLVADPTDAAGALAANAQAHATAFFQALAPVGGYQPWMLRPWVDLEAVPAGWSTTDAVQWLAAITTAVDAGVPPACRPTGLYGNLSTLTALGRAPNVALLADRPLWVAWWDTATPPPDVGPWTRWACWQLTDNKRLPVTPRAVDWDEWAGPVSALPRPPAPGRASAPPGAPAGSGSDLAAALAALAARVTALEARLQQAGQALQG